WGGSQTEANQEGETPGMVPKWMKDEGVVILPKALRANLPIGDQKTPVAFIPDFPFNSVSRNLQPLRDIIPFLKGEPGGFQELSRGGLETLGRGGVPGGLLQPANDGLAGRRVFSGKQEAHRRVSRTRSHHASLLGEWQR